MRRTLILLLGAIGFWHALTMPAFKYPGDNVAPQKECEHLLAGGEFGIPFARKAELERFLVHRGQYFFENDSKQRFFSKYGIANTALYAPPLLVYSLHLRINSLEKCPRALQFILNIYHIALTLIIALYLYHTVSLYTDSVPVRLLFILLSFYTTFLWYYLRAPTLEIYQILAFQGMYYHFIRFLRRGDHCTSAHRHLLCAASFAGLLILLKTLFVILIPILMAFTFPVAGKRRKQALASVAGPVVLALVLLSITNYCRFGSPLRTGYGQWADANGVAVNRFSIKYAPAALASFLLLPGNANMFLHYPLFGFGLPGIVPFFRRHRLEALFVFALFLSNFAVICNFSSWSGAWCYGPRYLVHILMLGSLPVLTVLDYARAHRRLPRVKVAGVAAVLILAVSAKLQFNMVSHHYFTYEHLAAVFSRFEDTRIQKYFGAPIHRGLVIGDFMAHRPERPFYPVRVLVGESAEAGTDVDLHALNEQLEIMSQPNYYLLYVE